MSSEPSIPTYGSDRADLEHLGRTETGARVKVSHDGREWVCVVDQGGEVDIEIARRDGSPADLETPDWLVDNLSRLAAPV